MIPKNTREGPRNYSFKYMTQNERSRDVIRIPGFAGKTAVDM